MERMTIRVHSVDRDHETNTEVGRVMVVSRRQLKGLPVATLELRIRVSVIENERPASTKRRVLDEALLFLDPE